jgi:hypothetical protein
MDPNVALRMYGHGPDSSIEHWIAQNEIYRNELYRAHNEVAFLLRENSKLKAKLMSSKEEVTDLRIVNVRSHLVDKHLIHMNNVLLLSCSAILKTPSTLFREKRPTGRGRLKCSISELCH